MAALVDHEPELDPDALLASLPRDLWGALVLQVIGQQLSLAAAGANLARLEALQGGRLPSPSELLGIPAQTLRGIGLSGAKSVYLHDLAARLEDGRLDPERLATLDDDQARTELMQVKGVGQHRVIRCISRGGGCASQHGPPPRRAAALRAGRASE
jgi:DNA-3-methyladenine glycosylase II